MRSIGYTCAAKGFLLADLWKGCGPRLKNFFKPKTILIFPHKEREPKGPMDNGRPMHVLASSLFLVGLAPAAFGQGMSDAPCEATYEAAIENPVLWEKLENFPAATFTREQAFYTAALQVQYDLWWQIQSLTERSVFENDSQPFAFIANEDLIAANRTPLTGDERRTLADLFFLTERLDECLGSDGPVLHPFDGSDMVAYWRKNYPDALRQRVRSYLEAQ